MGPAAITRTSWKRSDPCGLMNSAKHPNGFCRQEFPHGEVPLSKPGTACKSSDSLDSIILALRPSVDNTPSLFAGKWFHVKDTTSIGEGKLFSPGNLRATFDNPEYEKVRRSSRCLGRYPAMGFLGLFWFEVLLLNWVILICEMSTSCPCL